MIRDPDDGQPSMSGVQVSGIGVGGGSHNFKSSNRQGIKSSF
jgi:hypothetical protein